MSKPRRRFTAEQKVLVLREHLKNRTSVSEICEKYGIHPNVFYRWEKQLFEGALGVFGGEGTGKRSNGRETAKEKKFKEKLTKQQEVIAWLTEENLKLKKTFGEG